MHVCIQANPTQTDYYKAVEYRVVFLSIILVLMGIELFGPQLESKSLQGSDGQCYLLVWKAIVMFIIMTFIAFPSIMMVFVVNTQSTACSDSLKQ